MLHRLRIRTHNTTVPPDLRLFVLDICQGSLCSDGVFVREDEYVVVFTEEAVDVFEGAVGGFGEEEVDDGNEGGVEDGPDDVEFPVEGLDAWIE